jgi:DtxR family Mn-dependent transcriptional regulator
MPSSTVENYLKAIYGISEDSAELALVPIGKIAEALELTPGTVTTMMKHLDREGFIRYHPRKGVELLDAGRKAALQVLRRHRLIELFLVEVLHLDWAHVHEEAEVLEHALSDLLVERIDEMLGRPAYDPHGDPIPDAAGAMREDRSRSLVSRDPGPCRLVRVSRDEPEFLQWLQNAGLRPGVDLVVVGHDRLGGVVEIEVGGNQLRLGETAAEALWVV